MTPPRLKPLVVAGAAAVCALTTAIVSTQGPAGGPPQTVQAPPGGGGRGRGGLPGATPAQTQAVVEMNLALAPLAAAVTAARNELALATFADVKSEAALKAAVEKLRAAELALATRRADEFDKLQAGPNRLSPAQVTALIAAGGNVGAPGRGGAGPGRGRGGN